MPRRSIKYSTPDNLNVVDIRTGKVSQAPSLPVICANFRHFRIASGMEQKEIAERIGVYKNAISSWETGRTRPDINFIPAICRELKITPYELLGMPEDKPMLSKRSEQMLRNYETLDDKYKNHIDSVMQSILTIQEEENVPDLYPIELMRDRLAAGSSVNFFDITESDTLYLHDSKYLARADCLFRVTGNSMKPRFHDGDLVYVERFPKASPLSYGEIGAFAIGNETYIKQFEEDGLHSLNPEYSTIRYDAYSTDIYTIGRVLGIVDPALIATDDEVNLFRKYNQ